MGTMQQMMGDMSLMREDVSFMFLSGVVGVAMPFQHFFMSLTIAGFIRNGVADSISGGVYSYLFRYHVADNLVRALQPIDVTQSIMMSVKYLYGIACLAGCFFLLLMMLWHVQPVRSTLKHIPYWNKIGRNMRRELTNQS